MIPDVHLKTDFEKFSVRGREKSQKRKKREHKILKSQKTAEVQTKNQISIKAIPLLGLKVTENVVDFEFGCVKISWKL